ncbi:MAG: Ig-like domain-containing protein, partial [Paludibacteraceae bacterium]|nr:Ig-like domain-containing protein [Paludibacteraceae bacterium]
MEREYMKKQIIFLLLALLVVGMSACKEEKAKTMTLNPDAAIIGVGESLIIQPSVSGNGKWTSSDESVAVVSDGIVIGIGIGSATITATINDHVGTATIHVVDKGTTPTTYRSMALSPELTILEAGKTQQLTPAVSGTIRWSSSNPSAVSISGGIATAVGEGKSVVRAVVGSNEGKAVVYAVQS